MSTNHPITPPPELMKEWIDAWYNAKVKHANMTEFVAIQAARWGYQQCMKLDAAWLEAKLQKARDQELEACCEWMLANARFLDAGWIERLRSSRRPKPPSLKEQALEALGHLDKGAEWQMDTTEAVDTIRRALEQLDD